MVGGRGDTSTDQVVLSYVDEFSDDAWLAISSSSDSDRTLLCSAAATCGFTADRFTMGVVFSLEIIRQNITKE